MRLLLWIGLMMASSGLHAEAPVDPDGLPQSVDTATLKADADGDGKLSFEEFKAARVRLIEQQFEHLDTNHDGFVDAEERQLAIERLKSQLQSLRAAHPPSP
ncbi:EF-hand domain-containing protein [Methylophilus aquaticus]|uniref:EF-hand domain-containing protein n=1 Tax=Methylophilus aquaticus TaxID=1971610 RepID=A0ABT9JU91_9PROT|nr:EF-hand domain-containing protein [Methylophilus aquaticus]MDP8568156.1 EF-hand domain-containing protein [Methylophilus aquaticus]